MFKVDELIKVIQGRLLFGKKDTLVSGVSIDSRTIKAGELFIALKGNHFDGHDFVNEAIKKKAGAVIVEELKNKKDKFPIPIIKVKDALVALADIANYHRKKFNIAVIGITGSNGKTTVKDMLAWILETKFKVLKNPGTQNNQIGLPMALLKLDKNFAVAVLEMGTNHFGEIPYLTRIAQPHIGIITNIGPAHLEFLKNLKCVYREKAALINNLIPPSIAVLNMDDDLLRQNIKDNNKFIIGFAIKRNADYRASKIKRKKKQVEFLVNKRYCIQLNTAGFINVYNALAAISVARLFGIDYNIIAQRLANFKFPQGRLIFINKDNINFIDDTYNSNPASLKEALDTLDNLKVKGKKIFIMGDMLELGSQKENFHCLAGKQIAKVCDILITVGENARLAAKGAQEAGLDKRSIFNCCNSPEAKTLLINQIRPQKNDVILVKGSRLMQMEKVM